MARRKKDTTEQYKFVAMDVKIRRMLPNKELAQRRFVISFVRAMPPDFAHDNAVEFREVVALIDGLETSARLAFERIHALAKSYAKTNREWTYPGAASLRTVWRQVKDEPLALAVGKESPKQKRETATARRSR